jgi:nucleotide-binding universal stress UspA family protein
MILNHEVVIIYSKILLATDGSFHANNAAEQVLEFQKKWKSKVVIFHSIKHHKIPMGLIPNESLPIELYQNMEEATKKAGEYLLNKTKEIFDKAGLSIETRLIEDDEPEVYIRRIVEQENFDLVVLGSKGQHSKLKEILLGTVSINVVKSAPCDVLIVK